MDQPFSAHGHANMIDGCRNGQIGTIKTNTRRGIQIDTEMLSPTVPLISTGILLSRDLPNDRRWMRP
jgi:hypothetical protein